MATEQLFENPSLEAVQSLLAANDLPIDDLSEVDFSHFFGFGTPQLLKGLVGIELFDNVALLRSLAVADTCRGTGLGKTLVAHIEDYAKDQGVQKLYLLTTTAQNFFAKLGYEDVARNQAPKAIRNTREFAGICPGSAAFMVKALE